MSGSAVDGRGSLSTVQESGSGSRRPRGWPGIGCLQSWSTRTVRYGWPRLEEEFRCSRRRGPGGCSWLARPLRRPRGAGSRPRGRYEVPRDTATYCAQDGPRGPTARRTLRPTWKVLALTAPSAAVVLPRRSRSSTCSVARSTSSPTPGASAWFGPPREVHCQ